MNFVEKIKELYTTGEYETAISLIDESNEDWNQNSIILVWKARCLQLLNDNVPEDVLEQVENYLKQALKLDEEHQEALIELAYFYLRIIDDAEKARPLFEKSLALIAARATESTIGLAECISESDSITQALEYLDKKDNVLNLDSEKLNVTRKELLDSLAGLS